MLLILALGIAAIAIVMIGIIVHGLLWLVIVGAVLLLITFVSAGVAGRTSSAPVRPGSRRARPVRRRPE